MLKIHWPMKVSNEELHNRLHSTNIRRHQDQTMEMHRPHIKESQQQGVNNRETTTGSQQQGVNNRESTTGSQQQGVNNRESTNQQGEGLLKQRGTNREEVVGRRRRTRLDHTKWLNLLRGLMHQLRCTENKESYSSILNLQMTERQLNIIRPLSIRLCVTTLPYSLTCGHIIRGQPLK